MLYLCISFKQVSKVSNFSVTSSSRTLESVCVLKIQAQLLVLKTVQLYVNRTSLQVQQRPHFHSFVAREEALVWFMTENSSLNFIFVYLIMYPKESALAEFLCCFPEPQEVGAFFCKLLMWLGTHLKVEDIFFPLFISKQLTTEDLSKGTKL